MTDKEYVDWQKILSDEFDVDGYTLSQGSAKDFYLKFRKAKADGFRMAVEIMKEKHNPDARSEIIDEGKDERYFYTRVRTISLWDIMEEAASKLDPPAS